MSSIRIEVRAVRKWKAEKAVGVAGSRLRQKALVGGVPPGTAGLSCFPNIHVSQESQERHHLL